MDSAAITSSLLMYEDALAQGWTNWSWGAAVHFKSTAQVHSGSYSIRLTTSSSWGGLYLHSNASIDTANHTHVRFAARAGGSGQKYGVTLYDPNLKGIKTLPLAAYGGDPSPTAWRVYEIPLGDLNGGHRHISGVSLHDLRGAAQQTLHVDGVQFISRKASPPPTTEVTTPATGDLPWLKTSGNRIVVAATGEDVVLRGANVLRSEWDLRMDAERKAIPALAGQWKGNVILRGFASDPVLAGDAHYLAMLDEHVSLAATHRMYVVFAWRSHNINGPQPTMPDDRAQNALARLASRYHGVSHVMYALQVEPHDVTWATLQPRFVRMVDAIHAAASPHKPIVMVPGISWGRDVSGAISLPVARENVVYKTHPYNDQGLFKQQFLDTYTSGKPVFIGEFGYLGEHGMDMADVQALMDLANWVGLGWTAWAFDFQGGPALVTDNTTFNPTYPFGAAVKAEMLKTPAIPGTGATTDTTPTVTSTRKIYDDALQSGWVNWSWSTSAAFQSASEVYNGAYAIRFTTTASWGGLYLHSNTAVDTAPYTHLRFAARAGAEGERYAVTLFGSSDQVIKTVPLSQHGGDPGSAAWRVYELPLSELKGTHRYISGISIQDARGTTQQTLHLDDVALIAR